MDSILDDPTLGDPLEVSVRGETFTGWKSVNVTRPLDAATGAFELTLGPSLRPSGFPIRPGDPVQLRVDQELLLDGYVDAVQATLESDGDTVRGRDRTADLVDSTLETPRQFTGALAVFAPIVTGIAADYGIDVDIDSPLAIEVEFRTFALTPGETAWTAIDRAARLAGVLVYSRGDGNLVAADAGSEGRAVGELVQAQGEGFGNVRQARLSWDNSRRFDPIVVRGQRPGSDFDFGQSVAVIEGRARDPEVGRPRPLLIVAEGAVTAQDAARRAEWEATRRAARARRLTVETPSWRQASRGPLWRVNQLVRTRIPRLGVDAELLVNRVQFRRRANDRSAVLELVPADAFALQPETSSDSNPFASFFQGGGE